MTFHSRIDNEESQEIPIAKRRRFDSQPEDVALPPDFLYCQKLLATSSDQPLPLIPASLKGDKIRNNLDKLRQVFDRHGLKTSSVSSPREAVSVFKDSFFDDTMTNNDTDMAQGREFLLTVFGLHPNQEELERVYTTSIKQLYCLMLFCQRLRLLCREALKDEGVNDLVSGIELQCRSMGKMTHETFSSSSQILTHARALSTSVPRLVATLIQRIIQAEPRHRIEQLEREYDRIRLQNATLANVFVTLFTKEHQCVIKEIHFKRSHLSKYERITIYLYDPNHDMYKPPPFLFLPKLHVALTKGPDAMVQGMINSFWSHLLRYGYFASGEMKTWFNDDLKEFFLSGLAPNPHTPLLLNAHFSPTRPLSFYLHGKAGAGKSSFVRNFQPALEATVEETADPEILARFVKQNLNKRFDVLELELELRPNNNDMSVMSIITGRRMTVAQSKPGLVVIDLEEMPSNHVDCNPNQLNVAQLISQRFSGRTGGFQTDQNKAAPRNSGKRSIANDASLLTLFTSNYELDDSAKAALQRLKMFEKLKTVELTAVAGEDRSQFAMSYLNQCIQDRFPDLKPVSDIRLNIDFGSGDTRPLVRYLRMIAFYICAPFVNKLQFGCKVEADVKQSGKECLVSAGGESVVLKQGAMDNLFPSTTRIYDSRLRDAMKQVSAALDDDRVQELSVVLDFWLAKTLAPAVVVSNDASKVKKLFESIRKLKDVFGIGNVDAATYKMMKSLYDPNDTPNLRDDILKYGRGASVAVEISCPTANAQLCIREIIEDSPSMTAFSTAKSALHKDGLLFCVHVEGEISPEVRSRASIIL